MSNIPQNVIEALAAAYKVGCNMGDFTAVQKKVWDMSGLMIEWEWLVENDDLYAEALAEMHQALAAGESGKLISTTTSTPTVLDPKDLKIATQMLEMQKLRQQADEENRMKRQIHGAFMLQFEVLAKALDKPMTEESDYMDLIAEVKNMRRALVYIVDVTISLTNGAGYKISMSEQLAKEGLGLGRYDVLTPEQIEKMMKEVNDGHERNL
jgi:hypothetical protein